MSTTTSALSAAATLSNTERGVGCVAYDPTVATPYHYVPNLAAGIIFSTVFALTVIAHTYQFVSKRAWWYATLALGCVGELLGWAARTENHFCVYNKTFFVMQIAILIIAPCFFSAGIYYILSQLIRKWGQQYSPISANLYLFIFVGADLASIVIQGVGGGTAASASNKSPPQTPTTGGNIMLAGICVQLFFMVIFTVLYITTLYRARDVPKSFNMKLLLFATSFAGVLIFTRNFYRAIELGVGWTGYLMTNQVYFTVLDGALMALTAITFNVVHPAFILASEEKIQTTGPAIVSKIGQAFPGRYSSDGSGSGSEYEGKVGHY